MASPRTKLTLVVLAVFTGVGALWLVTAMRPSDQPGDAIEISGPMPDLSGESVTGGTFDSGIDDGDVVVVNFWASWCGPCREEQPGLQRLSEEYAGRGVAFVGVNFRDDGAAAGEYLREFSVTYPSVVDDDGKIAHSFGIPYLPATVLVDASGEMRYRLLGAQPETRIRGYVEELLGRTESA